METLELDLLRNVVATLGYSSEVSVEKKSDAMQIVVEYNSAVPQTVIDAICTLITGLETTYSGTANRSKLNDQSSSGEEQLDLDLQSSEQTPKQQSDSSAGVLNPDTATSVSPTMASETGEGEDGVFDRPLSLKGQRHIFLYKCRYAKLKAVIDSFNCWNLRISPLTDKWPCLLVYCAKNKEVWRSAFKRINKLEKSCFLRRKISDNLQTVDLQKLESLVEYYGQK